MGRERITVIRPGVYQAPQGTLHATRARIQGWADRWKAMAAKDIRVPVAWGHQPDAVPGSADDRAKRQYYLSRYNAGYVQDVGVDGKTGALYAIVDVPGLERDKSGNLVTMAEMPDGSRLKCAIGEVSVGIRDWRDGQGTRWPDAMIHLALTPLPVVAGQGGFRDPEPAVGEIHLGLTSLLYELSTEVAVGGDEKPMKKEKEKEKEKEDPPAGEPPAGMDKGSDAYFKEGSAWLATRGISLPDDTTAENFWERLCIAAHALDNQEEAEAELGDEELDNPDPNADAPVVQEQQPVMMSLASVKDPGMRVMIGREQERVRRTNLFRIDRLVKRGLPVYKANAMRVQVQGYELALTADGTQIDRPLDVELSIWEQALPKGKKFSNEYLAEHTRVEPRPDNSTDYAAQEAAGDELAALAGAPTRK